jgi:hypothetical protein
MILHFHIFLDPTRGPNVVLTECWPSSAQGDAPPNRVGFGPHALDGLTHRHNTAPPLNYFAAILIEAVRSRRKNLDGHYKVEHLADDKLLENLRPREGRKRAIYWSEIFRWSPDFVAVAEAKLEPQAGIRNDKVARQALFCVKRGHKDNKDSLSSGGSLTLLDPWKDATVRFFLHDSLASVSDPAATRRLLIPTQTAGTELIYVPAPGGPIREPVLHSAIDGQPALSSVIDGLRLEPLRVSALALLRKGPHGTYQPVPAGIAEDRFPVTGNDALRLELSLNRVGYLYLLAVDEEGVVVPFYPWQAKVGWKDAEAAKLNTTPQTRICVGFSAKLHSDGKPEGIALRCDHPASHGFIALASEERLELDKVKRAFEKQGLPLGVGPERLAQAVELALEVPKPKAAFTAGFVGAPEAPDPTAWLVERIASLSPDDAQLLIVPVAGKD